MGFERNYTPQKQTETDVRAVIDSNNEKRSYCHVVCESSSTVGALFDISESDLSDIELD